MREGMGLYRGKRLDNGEWVEGNLLTSKDGAPDRDFAEILVKDKHGYGVMWCEVDMDTIGQWTGLVDKNGVKVFEGDIVRITDDDGNTDFCDGGIGAVEFLEGMWYVGGQVNNGLHDLRKCYFIEKIGSIHDKAVEE